MKSSIYISSEIIEIIGYSGKGRGVSIKDYASCPLHEGTMINGKIMDTADLTECLASLRKSKPKLFTSPILIVDGNSILSKRITVPKLKKRVYDQIVRDDFHDVTEQQLETVSAWHMLREPDKTSGEILACAADSELIDSYISAFKAAGIRLKSIHVGVEAIINYVNLMPGLKDEAFVLNIIDGVMMLSMIFDHGINVFMSRTRLYRENYDQFIMSIQENLSGLIQFTKSEKFNEISRSYYLGLGGEDISFMQETNRHENVELVTLDIFENVKGASNLTGDAYLSYFNAVLGDDSIDLVKSRRALEKLKKKQKPKKYWIPLLVILVVIIATPIAWLFKETAGYNSALNVINAYLTDEAVIAKSQELDEIQAQTAKYQNVTAQHEAKRERESGNVPVSNELLDLITKTHTEKVTVVQIDYDERARQVRVNGRSATETDSSAYVDALRRSELILSVAYAGYSYSSLGEYDFTIDIGLAAGEAEQ